MRVLRLVLGTTLLCGAQEAWARIDVRPFDVSAAQGTSHLPAAMGEALARVVSNEIERRNSSSDRALVLRGTLVQARASTAGGRGAGFAATRQTAEVLLAIRLIDPATGEIVAVFDTAGKATDAGLSVDFVTALVGFSRQDDDWRRSPMGQAILQAAERVAEEVAAWSQDPDEEAVEGAEP